MTYARRLLLKRTHVFGLAALVIASCVVLNISAEAQSGSPPANAGSDPIGQIIVSNASTPGKICSAIAPLLRSSPQSASKVIDRAQATPELLEPLCGCVSKTRKALEMSEPVGAKIIAKAVAESSPAFQACYAVASSAGQDRGRSEALSSETDAERSDPTAVPYSPSVSSGTSAFGGGPVSPN